VAIKIYKFGEYTIKIFDSDDELKNSPLLGFRSLCPNKVNKPVGIEIVGDDMPICEKEWAFCHLINSINNLYKLILEEVK
jgi:hypothetical protein